MFELTTLFTLLLAPVLAFIAGALVFSLFELINKEQALLVSHSAYRSGHSL
jgi:hypothetical protein